VLKEKLSKRIDKNNELLNANKGLAFQKEQRLEEVVVIGYAAQRKRDVTGSIATVNGKDLAGINNLGFALKGRAAGLLVVNNANPLADPKIRIRGNRSFSGMDLPLFVVNGIPVEQPNLSSLNPNDIENITVLKDGAAIALYGSKAANGVIIIESKKFRNEKLRFSFNNGYNYASQLIRVSGASYTIAKRFYIPRYTTVNTDERTDFRETIYWNPVVQTDKNGRAVVEFYNSDASTTFRAIAEGIGWNGKLGRGEATYVAQNAMSVDAKIPPYLTCW
jgi:TonB-dependent SusC/RagA subfamily outer membrane receptor